MENVSNALLMAAGILLAVLTISIATYLFRAGANVANAYQNSNEENELNIFNSNFTRMVSGNGSLTADFNNTIYDVITVANFAWNNNVKYVEDPLSNVGDPRMLVVNICDASGNVVIGNIQNLNQRAYDKMAKAGYFVSAGESDYPLIIYYNIDIAGYSAVGRINKVNFTPKNDDYISQLQAITTEISKAEYQRND